MIRADRQHIMSFRVRGRKSNSEQIWSAPPQMADINFSREDVSVGPTAAIWPPLSAPVRCSAKACRRTRPGRARPLIPAARLLGLAGRSRARALRACHAGGLPRRPLLHVPCVLHVRRVLGHAGTDIALARRPWRGLRLGHCANRERESTSRCKNELLHACLHGMRNNRINWRTAKRFHPRGTLAACRGIGGFRRTSPMPAFMLI
jgi:hypothetical protein